VTFGFACAEKVVCEIVFERSERESCHV